MFCLILVCLVKSTLGDLFCCFHVVCECAEVALVTSFVTPQIYEHYPSGLEP